MSFLCGFVNEFAGELRLPKTDDFCNFFQFHAVLEIKLQIFHMCDIINAFSKVVD